MLALRFGPRPNEVSFRGRQGTHGEVVLKLEALVFSNLVRQAVGSSRDAPPLLRNLILQRGTPAVQRSDLRARRRGRHELSGLSTSLRQLRRETSNQLGKNHRVA